MKQESQRFIIYLQHISQAISRINHYLEDCDEITFLSNELLQDAVVRNLEVVGEASHNIDKHCPEHLQQYAHIPFLVAYEMRNALAHGYFKIDFEVVWQTIERDLPEFDVMVTTLLEKLES